MRRTLCTIALLTCAALFGVGCDGGDFDVVVDLKTDLVPGVEFTAVEIAFNGGAAIPHVPSEGTDYLRGARVAEVTLPRGTHDLEVRLVRGVDRVIVQPVVVTVDGPRAVTVVITRDCRGVVCPGAGDATATACLGGRCVDPGCTPETPELCPPPQCQADSECAMRDACSTPRCVDGACLYEDSGICDAAEYCDPDVGCLERPATMGDGGVLHGDGFEWAASVGSASDEFGWSIARARDVVVVGGIIRSALVEPTAVPHVSVDDAIVVAFDASGGGLLWTRSFATSGVETIVDIASDGTDFYVTGTYVEADLLGGAGPMLPSTGRTRTYLVRLDRATGATVGTPFTIGSDETVAPEAIAVTETGNVVFALRCTGDVVFADGGAGTTTSPIFSILAEVDLEPTPTQAWLRVIDDEDLIVRSIETAGSRALFVGTFQEDVFIPAGAAWLRTTNTTPEGFVLSLLSGGYQWARTLTSAESVTMGGGAVFGAPASVALTLQHRADVQVEGGPLIAPLSSPTQAGHVVTFDSMGVYGWSTRFNDAAIDTSLHDVAFSPPDQLVVSGSVTPAGYLGLMAASTGEVLDLLELTHSNTINTWELVDGPTHRPCVTGFFIGGVPGDRLVPVSGSDVWVGCGQLAP